MTDKLPLNNALPLYFANESGVHEIYNGMVQKLYNEVKVDPASAFGDYGCGVEYRMNADGNIEIVHVEYLEPRNG